MHHVAPSVTWGCAALLTALILCLALEEKLHIRKSILAGSFASVALLLGAALHLLPFEPVTIAGQQIRLPVYIPAVDWEVIAIILGASIFVDVTSRSGLFTWIAIRLTKASGGDPLRLLWYYGGMTVLFSAVLNNVTAMIIVGSLTSVSLEKLKRRDILLGFLLVEGLLTNVGGLLTLISSVPNIIVGNTAGISFVSFFLKASPYVVVTTVITLLMGARIFAIRSLQGTDTIADAAREVAAFDERDGIDSQGFFWFGAVMTLAFVGVMATTSILPFISELGMGYVAMTFAAIMLLRYKHEVDQFYRAVDWDLLGFFVALFVFINVMEHAQVLALIGEGVKLIIALGDVQGTAAVLVAAAGFSSVTDNIPLAAMLAKIIVVLPDAAGNLRGPDDPIWWSVIFGANLGGNITPIGSASTMVAVTIMHKQKLDMSFGRFVASAAVFAVVQIALATVYVLVVLR
jgi:Na+/H+ antiporter NhaD/arsenite permease-like protein